MQPITTQTEPQNFYFTALNYDVNYGPLCVYANNFEEALGILTNRGFNGLVLVEDPDP